MSVEVSNLSASGLRFLTKKKPVWKQDEITAPSIEKKAKLEWFLICHLNCKFCDAIISS